MEQLIKKLKIRYTVISSLIVGVLLFLLLSCFFALLYGSTELFAHSTIQNVFSDPLLSTDISSGKICLIFFENDDQTHYSNIQWEYYGDDAEEILEKSMAVKDGKFKVGDNYFRVSNQPAPDKSTMYVVYDRTSDYTSLTSSAALLALVYLSSLILIIIFCYLISKQQVKPIQESFIKQKDLIANASHELKTPLTIISTNLSVMKSEPKSDIESNQKWITSIDSQLLRMQGLIHDMLELSKLEQSIIPKQPVNFSALVEGVCLAFEGVCFEKDLTLITKITPELYILAEKNAIERLIIILMDNALKYANKSGKVGCTLTMGSNKKVILSVMNTGVAISSEDSKRVFERFYRSDGARKNQDNLSFGLGLPIAQATVLNHNGTINCKGVNDSGTVFDVTFNAIKHIK